MVIDTIYTKNNNFIDKVFIVNNVISDIFIFRFVPNIVKIISMNNLFTR